jgi:Ser/Thr protein kinase RdoA (MazF antagonist)
MKLLYELLENWNITKPFEVIEVDITKFENRMPNAWIVNDSYVLKRSTNPDYAKTNMEIMKVLDKEGIPVAVPLRTKTGDDYLVNSDEYYCLFPRIRGKGIKDHFEGDYLSRAGYLGHIIGNLHSAFNKCENFINCSDSNLFIDIANWAIPAAKEFQEKRGVQINAGIINGYESEFSSIHAKLPRQIIHRDMHAENMLFENGCLKGYIDFDLTQKNIRIFDPCYMCTGILSGCINDAGKREQWINIFKKILEGYDSVCKLSNDEKRAIIYVLYSIQLIFIAYFAQNGYPEFAEKNIVILNWICENKNRLEVI